MENIGGENHTEGYEWLLAYLLEHQVEEGYRLGIPKTYITKKNEIHGYVGQSIQLTTSEIIPQENIYVPTANTVTTVLQLRCSSKPMRRLNINHSVSIRGISTMLSSMLIWGEKVSSGDLENPYFTNPFYNDYNILIDLSKKIINQEGSDFGYQQESSAFFLIYRCFSNISSENS